MRLVNPGAGEQSDRLTILALKILFGTTMGKPTNHFETERAALLTQIRTRTLNGKWFEAYTELAAVNAALWHMEDDLRLLRKQEATAHENEVYYHDVVQTAFRIQALNDQRAALIERINKDAGDHLGVEKSHVEGEERG